VNSKWWEYSTEICHALRVIRLKQIPPATASERLSKVPWSFYIFEKDVALSEELKSFIRTQGFRLRKIIVESNYYTSPVDMEGFGAEVLYFTPNLEFLCLNGRFERKEEPAARNYSALLRLKHLTIRGGSLERQEHHDWFLQLFWKSPLRYVSLSLGQPWGRTVIDAQPAVDVLKRVPTVSLYLDLKYNSSRPEYLKPFLTSSIRMKKFGFSLGGPLEKEEALNDKGYFLMSQLLERTADTIEELDMGGDGGISSSFGGCSPFQFPILPKIKSLKLRFPGNADAFLTTLFSELTPVQMPLLATITISDMFFPPPSSMTRLFRRDVFFDNVKQLLVKSSHFFADSWGKSLPNLQKLKTEIMWRGPDVQIIYNCKHLEDLELKATVRGDYATNASQLISGIPVTENIERKSDEEIKEIQLINHLPHILQLTSWKLLVFEL